MIIGGGGSGLVAAGAAAENGIKNIIVLEKAGRVGGNELISIARRRGREDWNLASGL